MKRLLLYTVLVVGLLVLARRWVESPPWESTPPPDTSTSRRERSPRKRPTALPPIDLENPSMGSLLEWFPASREDDAARAAFGRGDHATAFALWKPLAEAGSQNSQVLLAFCYEQGYGTSVDQTKALKWYRAAAEQGNPVAQFKAALMYDDGIGTPVDDGEAVRWYRASAEQGMTSAQLLLGAKLADGEGTAKDPREAVDWWRLAAETGDSGALFRLGMAYEEGQGVRQSEKTALTYYRKAARKGYELAKLKLRTLGNTEQLAEELLTRRLPQLLELLRREDTREHALLLLSQVDESAIPDLMKAIRDPEIGMHAAALLGMIGAASVPPLVEALADPDPEVRNRIVCTLAHLKKVSMARVVDVLGDTERIRGATAFFVACGIESAGPPLVRAVLEREPTIKLAAVLSLCVFGEEGAPHIRSALKRGDQATKLIIVAALGLARAKAEPMLPALQKLLESEHEKLRGAAAAAIQLINDAD